MSNDELERMLSDAALPADQRFDAGFADRVSARIAARGAAHAEQTGSLSYSLARQARRVLPALVAASLAVTAWNWWSVRDSADSSVAAALGLQPVTLSTALTTGSLLGAEELQ
jgi:peptidoglycan/LPS O-acetylase OafA/YrhL